MDKKLLLCALGAKEEVEFDEFGEIWTMNDWYLFDPDYTPDRVYNIHANFMSKPKPSHRFIDWLEVYRNTDCPIISREDWGLNNQFFYNDKERFELFGEDFFTHTLCYMLADAYCEGYREIYIYRLSLDIAIKDYLNQIRGILRAFDKMRSMGASVYCRNEDRARKDVDTVDWSTVQEINYRYE